MMTNMVNAEMPIGVAYNALLTELDSYAIYKCGYKENPEMFVLSRLNGFDATKAMFTFVPTVYRWKMKGDEKFIPYFLEEYIEDFNKIDGIQGMYLYPTPKDGATEENLKKMSDLLKLIYEFTDNCEFVVDTKGEGIDFFKEMSNIYGGAKND